MYKGVQIPKEVFDGLNFIPLADLLALGKWEGKTKTEIWSVNIESMSQHMHTKALSKGGTYECKTLRETSVWSFDDHYPSRERL